MWAALPQRSERARSVERARKPGAASRCSPETLLPASPLTGLCWLQVCNRSLQYGGYLQQRDHQARHPPELLVDRDGEQIVPLPATQQSPSSKGDLVDVTGDISDGRPQFLRFQQKLAGHPIQHRDDRDHILCRAGKPVCTTARIAVMETLARGPRRRPGLQFRKSVQQCREPRAGSANEIIQKVRLVCADADMTCGLIVVKYINAPEATDVTIEVLPKSKGARPVALERPEPRLIKTSLQGNVATAIRRNANRANRLWSCIGRTS